LTQSCNLPIVYEIIGCRSANVLDGMAQKVVRQPNEQEKQELRTAIENDDKKTVERMINQDGININADISLWYFWRARGQSIWKEVLTWHYSPLHHAVTVKKLSMVQLLIEMGANINDHEVSVNMKYKKSLLHRAVQRDSCEIVYFLVKECKQDVSAFSKDEQRIIQAMIGEHCDKRDKSEALPKDLMITDGELQLN